MGLEEGDLFPSCLVNNQNNKVVEVASEIIPGPSNGSNDSQVVGEGDPIPSP